MPNPERSIIDDYSPRVIPQVKVFDWPDMEERGQWGGNAEKDILWTSALKLNMLDSSIISLSISDNGALRIGINEPVLKEALSQGVKFVLHVPHIGQLGEWYTIFKKYPETAGTGDLSKPLPVDYTPPLCFSKPQTVQLFGKIMEEVASNPEITELNVWLSEDNYPFCYCDKCQGKEETIYIAETCVVISGFRQAQKLNPNLKLRILLSQGSYKVNHLVFKEIPPDVKVIYYHGALTYDSSHRPMIYPLLEDFVKEGGWLGVYPQLNNSFATVFPFTVPQFIRTRMKEFVEKGLKSFAAYICPSNRLWEFNVAAAAEWSWNLNGRTEYEFARSWASRIGIRKVEKYAEWAMLIGSPSWDLAGSRFPMRFYWNIENVLSKPLRFGEGYLEEINSSEHLEKNLGIARTALALAKEIGEPTCLAESEIILDAYEFLKAPIEVSRYALANTSGIKDSEKSELSDSLMRLDAAAERIVSNLWKWGRMVDPENRETPYQRWQYNMSVFAQVVKEAYSLGQRLGIPDSRPEYRDRMIGQWKSSDFDQGQVAVLEFDITDYLSGPGIYRVMFRLQGGAYGIDIKSVVVTRKNGETETELVRVIPKEDGAWNTLPHLGRWDRWSDAARLELPEITENDRYFLLAEISGIPKDASADRQSELP